MRVAILGAGAVGGWLAATLHGAGVSVSVVARNASLRAIRDNGLRLIRNDVETRHDVSVGSGKALGPQDFVVIATKGHDVRGALGDLAPMLHSQTTVVSALNGLPWWFCEEFAGPLNNCMLESVDPGKEVAAQIAHSRVVGCVVHASASRPAPGIVKVGKAGRLIFGEPSGELSERVRWLADTFQRAGVPAMPSEKIRHEIWSKLWGNMNMGPISALTRSTTKPMLDDAGVRSVCLEMMREMATCGERIGLPFGISPDQRIEITRELGDIRTSMLQDLEARAAFEIEPQLGAVVEVAHKLGIRVPISQTVLHLTRLLSRSNQS